MYRYPIDLLPLFLLIFTSGRKNVQVKRKINSNYKLKGGIVYLFACSRTGAVFGGKIEKTALIKQPHKPVHRPRAHRFMTFSERGEEYFA